ncbi:sensor histidine kinase [Cohnella rhizosphaerae]|uniref:Histidine kinase/HSP90-like ATPase domain-containing protein n=1 Tax=Cohnella rhizosphaerae TaxID=1457232 RepID=A0A9X4QSC5_9BACL|nr:ATP-binding protein [Cohnella rhizosphaerae]MDG0809455.1 hypothetical protein [Cohnella rhizosphaerae]
MHGFMDEGQSPRIELRAEQEAGYVHIEIQDNGSGMEEKRMNAFNALLRQPEADSADDYKRVGLLNVLRRLRATYGPQADMRLMPGELGGLKVWIAIPMGRKDAHAQSDAG